MEDMISREKAIEEIKAVFEWHDTVTMERMIEHFNNLPSAQPEKRTENTRKTHGVCLDTISRQAAIDALDKHLQTTDVPVSYPGIISALTEWLNEVPSAQQDSKETSPTHKALDTISRQAAIRWVKTECNPYGKPTLDFESGKKVIEHLKQMPSAQPEITECPMCPDCPDNCPLEVEHD